MVECIIKDRLKDNIAIIDNIVMKNIYFFEFFNLNGTKYLANTDSYDIYSE